MKRNIYFIISILFIGLFVRCDSLDIPPKSILTDADIYNDGGITAYMVGLYNHLPIDDFNVTDDNVTDAASNMSTAGYFGWNSIVWPMLSTGETVNRNNPGIYIPQKGYYPQGYLIIRNANNLIENLPAYIGKLAGAESWIAEAKFIRAYVYFQLVKRYGGVPIVDKVQQITDTLAIARSSHEASYDFILSDLDYAIANMPATSDLGRANKYVAAAFKSRVALYAGSIARYGAKYSLTTPNGVMLCGIPASRANDYFQQAWDAAKIVEQGPYSLYSGDADKALNFENIFVKADNSPESIFIRQYNYTTYVHSFDAIYSPPRMTSTYGDRFNPTLDWVELFDGLPVDPATGKFTTTDADGNYIVYDNATSLFANAEPRLKGSLILPDDVFKGIELDIRRGIIDESVDPSTKIQKFVPDDYNNTTAYSSNTFYKNNVLESTEVVLSQTPYVTSTGVKLFKNGLDGPANGGSTNTLTGFHGKKWLNPALTPSATALHSSFQSWIDIRYAEVLLNRAEAALELAQNGTASYNGADMQQDAFDCMNKIRDRAGATLLTSPSDLSTAPANQRGAGPGGFVMAPTRGLQLVRVERYKELAFEHKIYWDLRRWFTFDQQIYNYRRRSINPFMFASGATVDANGNPVGKYIYDIRICERANNNLTFDPKYYYEKLPDDQIKTNPLLVQNNGY